MTSKELQDIVPRDKFYKKRITNLSKATDTEVSYIRGEVASVVFINRIFGFKFVTWLTNKKYRKMGQASRCLYKLQQRHRLLFAKVQKGNPASYNFAMKNGFRKLCNIPRLFNIHPGTLVYWKRR